MILEVDRVTRRFGSVVAVDELRLAMESGELVTLLGPSGCGKTTALRLIAGFEGPDEGRIRFQDRDVTELSPQQRGFGMVFQNYALFPHLDVFENVAFGLRTRRRAAEAIRRTVADALSRVDLAGYEERPVQALSGGQQQRVALARALAVEPPLLLLDEPLSNLDQALRVRTRSELRSLIKELGITAVFVTHDQEEAFDLSDRIAVMEAGRIRQIGTPLELYREPADRFVAGFVGRANVLPVEVVPATTGARGTGAGLAARLPDGLVWEVAEGGDPGGGAAGTGPGGDVADTRSGGGASGTGPAGDRGTSRSPRPGPGEHAVLLLRPEDLRFAGEEEVDALGGVVRDRRFRGPFTLYRVDAGGTELEVAASSEGPRVGERVRLRPRPGARLHLFPASRDGEEASGPAPSGGAASPGAAATHGAEEAHE